LGFLQRICKKLFPSMPEKPYTITVSRLLPPARNQHKKINPVDGMNVGGTVIKFAKKPNH